MRKTIFIFILCALALNVGAQTPEKSLVRDGNTFVQSNTRPSASDTTTAYKWRDTKGNEYPIILHRYTKGEKKGRTTAYVIRTSKKTGKGYKYYLPDGERIAEQILKETKNI